LVGLTREEEEPDELHDGTLRSHWPTANPMRKRNMNSPRITRSRVVNSADLDRIAIGYETPAEYMDEIVVPTLREFRDERR
jgi:hypothetical protein